MAWTIEARVFLIDNPFPLLPDFGHLFLDIFENGVRVNQFHGLATDRITDVPDEIGGPEDQLKAWWYPSANLSSPFSSVSNGVIFSGSNQADLDRALDHLALYGEYVNNLNITYNMDGQAGYNSNSVFAGAIEVLSNALSGMNTTNLNAVTGYLPVPGYSDSVFGSNENGFDIFTVLEDGGGNAVGIKVEDTGAPEFLVLPNALIGTSGNDELYALGGNDVLYGTAGSDIMDGGTEFSSYADTVDYSQYAGGVTVNLSGGNGTAVKSGGGTDTLIDIEHIRGAQGNDEIHGDAGGNIIYGSTGDDEIDGGTGNYNTTDYSSLDGGIVSVLSSSGWEVTKGTSGVLGTDTLSNMKGVVGTNYDDVFQGSIYGVDPGYAGGEGNDTYIFDLSVDRSFSVFNVTDTLAAGIDTITITNFVDLGDNIDGDMAFTFSTGGGAPAISFGEYESTGYPNYLSLFTITLHAPNGAGHNYDVLEFDGHIYALGDLIAYSDAQISGAFGEDDLENVYSGFSPTAGNDTVNASAAASAVRVSLFAGNDSFVGSSYADTVFGYDGNDTIEGGGGNDILNGDAGTDTLTYASAGSAITVNLATLTAQNTVGAGTDTISGFENLTGSASADTLTGDAGDNVIDGGAGNDTIQGGAGNDTLTGGSNTDTLTYVSASAGVAVSLAIATAQNTVNAGTDTVSGFENLTGSSFADALTGDANANVITGGDGDDIVEGGAGNDTLTAGNGADTASYSAAASAVTVNLATATAQNTVGAGTDTLSGFENLIGSAFNDTLTGTSSDNVMEGGAGNDSISGSGGTDTLTYANASAAVTVNLATATAQNTVGAGTDTISSFENLVGSAFNDTLTGTSGNNVMEGGAGNDSISGSGGTDTLTYVTASGGITISLAIGTAQNTGGAGTDTISSFENLTGSAYNDTLTGSSAANVINGGDGDDTIQGGTGDDTLIGGLGIDTLSYASASSGVFADISDPWPVDTFGAGEDTTSGFEHLIGSSYDDTLVGSFSGGVIWGGDGADTILGSASSSNDILNGQGGADTLYGNSGADIFVFEAASAFGASDTIMDFSTAQADKLDIADILSGYDPLTDLISDFVRITDNGSNSVLSVDQDGGANGFVQIAQLSGVTNIAAGATATEIELQTLITNGMLIAA